MRTALFILTTSLALASGVLSAVAFEALLVSAQSEPAGAAAPQQGSQGEVAANAQCRQVEVALDEGYGVSSHEIRYECGPNR